MEKNTENETKLCRRELTTLHTALEERNTDDATASWVWGPRPQAGVGGKPTMPSKARQQGTSKARQQRASGARQPQEKVESGSRIGINEKERMVYGAVGVVIVYVDLRYMT